MICKSQEERWILSSLSASSSFSFRRFSTSTSSSSSSLSLSSLSRFPHFSNGSRKDGHGVSYTYVFSIKATSSGATTRRRRRRRLLFPYCSRAAPCGHFAQAKRENRLIQFFPLARQAEAHREKNPVIASRAPVYIRADRLSHFTKTPARCICERRAFRICRLKARKG